MVTEYSANIYNEKIILYSITERKKQEVELISLFFRTSSEIKTVKIHNDPNYFMFYIIIFLNFIGIF